MIAYFSYTGTAYPYEGDRPSCGAVLLESSRTSCIPYVPYPFSFDSYQPFSLKSGFCSDSMEPIPCSDSDQLDRSDIGSLLGSIQKRVPVAFAEETIALLHAAVRTSAHVPDLQVWARQLADDVQDADD